MKLFHNGPGRRQSGKFYANGRRVRKEPYSTRGIRKVRTALGQIQRPTEKLVSYFASPKAMTHLSRLLGATVITTLVATAYYAHLDGGFAPAADGQPARATKALLAGGGGLLALGFVVPLCVGLGCLVVRSVGRKCDRKLEKDSTKPRSLIDARDIARMRQQRRQWRRP